MDNQDGGSEKVVVTSVRLPAEIYERLKKSPISVSGEIRYRIDRSFADEDNFDDQTRNLGEMMKWVAREVYLQTGCHWYERPEAGAAAVAAIQTWVASSVYPRESSPEEFQDDPQTLGRAITRSYFRIQEELTKPEVRAVRAQELRATGAAAKTKHQGGKS
jgi:hypothetical protein